MLDFPLKDLLDEEISYAWLIRHLWPDGLRCQDGHALPTDQAAHRYNLSNIPSYRCRSCGRVFNIFTGTVFSKTRFSAAMIVLILRGIVKGETTAQLARELEIDRSNLLEKRHRIQALLEERFPPHIFG